MLAAHKRLLALPAAQEARARFERNAKRRKRVPLGFVDLFHRFAEGEKFCAIAGNLGLSLEAIRKYWRVYYRSWLSRTRKRLLRMENLELRARTLARLEAGLPKDSTVRVVLGLARSTGCKASILYHDYAHVVTNAIRVQEECVLIYEARALESEGVGLRQPNVRFAVSKGSLCKHRYVVFLINVPGYRRKIFLRSTQEVLEAFFPPESQKRQARISATIARPKQKPRGFDLWRGTFGTALEAFGPFKNGWYK